MSRWFRGEVLSCTKHLTVPVHDTAMLDASSYRMFLNKPEIKRMTTHVLIISSRDSSLLKKRTRCLERLHRSHSTDLPKSFPSYFLPALHHSSSLTFSPADPFWSCAAGSEWLSRSSPAPLTPSRPSSSAWPLFTPQLSAGTGSFGVKNRRLQPPNDPSQLAPSQRQQDNGRCEGGATARRSEVKEKAHVVNFASVLLFPNPVTFARESAQNTQGHECKKTYCGFVSPANDSQTPPKQEESEKSPAPPPSSDPM